MSKICIVVPCYNEEFRLNTLAFTEFMTLHKTEYNLLFVNDGSTDNTVSVLEKITSIFPDNCCVLNLNENSGKAEAVRQGVNLAALNKEYTYIAYFDADLATPLSEINLMKSIVDNNQELIMVLCSRIKRLGASVNRNKKRHLLGRVFSTFASSILKLPVYDTQCGAKLIKAEIVPFTFNTPFLTSWIFDVEILARIRNGRKDKVTKVLYEHPVTQWEDIGGSKLKFKHMLKVPLELFKIKQFYNK